MATAVTVGASVGVAGAGFMAWSRTGRSRSGLELARNLHEVGLAPEGTRGALLVLFLFTPMLAAAVWLAALTRHRLLVALLGATTGTVAVAAAVLVAASNVRAAPGVGAALSAGILAIAGAVVLAFPTRDGEGDR